MKTDRDVLPAFEVELPPNLLGEEKARARLTEYTRTSMKMLGLLERREAPTWQPITYSLHRQEIQLARAGLHDQCSEIAARLMRERVLKTSRQVR